MLTVLTRLERSRETKRGRVAHRIFFSQAQSEYAIRLLVMAHGG
jgi:hypothetical protein